MVYRDLTINDKKAVKELITSLHNFHANLEPDRYRKVLSYPIKIEHDIAIGAFHDDKLVGLALGKLDDDFRTHKVMILDDFYVEEGYRNIGVGHELYSRFNEKAKELKANRIKLCVAIANRNALKIYSQLGFIPTSYNMEVEI